MPERPRARVTLSPPSSTQGSTRRLPEEAERRNGRRMILPGVVRGDVAGRMWRHPLRTSSGTCAEWPEMGRMARRLSGPSAHHVALDAPSLGGHRAHGGIARGEAMVGIVAREAVVVRALHGEIARG